MKQRIAQWLRALARRLDPPPTFTVTNHIYPRTTGTVPSYLYFNGERIR